MASLLDVVGSAGSFGKSPSAILLLQVIRHELVDILKRAENRGQILDHCNVELMVEEAMLESNLVEVVDEILSNCCSSFSLNGRQSTATSSRETSSCSSGDDDEAATLNSDRNKNERRNSMRSTFTEKDNEISKGSNDGDGVGDGSKSETGYIVKKIIFDGLEGWTYNNVASSNSSSSISSSDDDYHDTDNKTITEKHDKLIKFIKTPTIKFKSSSSCESIELFIETPKENVVPTASPSAGESNGDHLSKITLVDSDQDYHDVESDAANGSTKHNFRRNKPTYASIISMSKICASTTKLSGSPNMLQISGENLNIKTSSSIVRMREVYEAPKSPLYFMSEAEKFELKFLNEKIRRVKSCVILKSLQPELVDSFIKEIKGGAAQIKHINNAAVKQKKTGAISTMTARATARNFKAWLKNKPNKLKFTNFLANYKSLPLKNTLLKNKVNQQQKPKKTVLKSIKFKPNILKSDTDTSTAAATPNENRKIKEDIENFFEKYSKSESERLRKNKADVKKLQLQPRQSKKYKLQKQSSSSSGRETTKQKSAKMAQQPSIPVMSELWQTVQQASYMAKNTSQGGKAKTAAAPAPAPILLKSEFWMATTPKPNAKQLFATLIKCQASLTTVEQGAAATAAKQSYFSLIKSFLDKDKNQHLMKLKTKRPPQKPLVPDLQTKMLTAKWLSIAKQLKREKMPSAAATALAKLGDQLKVELPRSEAVEREQQEKMIHQATQTKQPDWAASSGVHMTPSIRSNSSNLCEKSYIEHQIAAQKNQSQNKLNNGGNNNQQQALMPTWSSLLRKCQKKPEQQTQQLATQSPRLKCSKSASSTLSTESVPTLMPNIEAAKADDVAESKFSRHINGVSATNFAMSREQSSKPSIRLRGGSTWHRKKVGFTHAKPMKTPTAFQRRENFMKTLKAPNFMLDAGDSVKSIDKGLNVQHLLNCRWKLEYEKREARRKAGKYDAATTMLASVVGPTLSEIQTQTELQKDMTHDLPTSPTSPRSVATVIVNKTFASKSERICSSNNEPKVSLSNDLQPKSKFIDIEANNETNNDESTMPTLEETPSDAATQAQQLLTQLELGLLSQDYFTTLLDEILALLKTTNLLLAKAFSSEPVTLWDVRTAGRKAMQLRVVKASLNATLQKQIDIMKTIVAYGKIIYPHDIRMKPAKKALLKKSQQKNEQTPPKQIDKVQRNCCNKNMHKERQARLQKTAAKIQSLHQYKLEMEERARIKAHSICQHTMMANSMGYTERLGQSCLQSTQTGNNTPPSPLSSPPSSPPLHVQEPREQRDVNAATATYRNLDYYSDMSSEYMCQLRTRKVTKRSTKKSKQTTKPPLEFQLTGFKQNNKNQHNNLNMQLRQQAQQQAQEQDYQNNYLLSASATKRTNAKRSKKSKSNVSNIFNNNSQPIATVRVPAKNAPCLHTSYVLPVPQHQPTGWELFKWNCGHFDNEANAHAVFHGERNHSVHNFELKSPQHYNVYRFLVPQQTPPIWK